MARVVVVLSGPVSSGKTTLATRLVNRFAAVHYKTSRLLEQRAEGHIELERTVMQEFGESLDRATNGAWVAQDLVPQINKLRRWPGTPMLSSIPRAIPRLMSRYARLLTSA